MCRGERLTRRDEAHRLRQPAAVDSTRLIQRWCDGASVRRLALVALQEGDDGTAGRGVRMWNGRAWIKLNIPRKIQKCIHNVSLYIHVNKCISLLPYHRVFAKNGSSEHPEADLCGMGGAVGPCSRDTWPNFHRSWRTLVDMESIRSRACHHTGSTLQPAGIALCAACCLKAAAHSLLRKSVRRERRLHLHFHRGHRRSRALLPPLR